jgi:hypothetical protein
MANTPENGVKKLFRIEATHLGVMYTSIPASQFSQPGKPDYIVNAWGRYVAVECKSPVGVLSETQKKEQRTTIDHQGIYIVYRGAGDLEKGLNDANISGCPLVPAL